MYIAYYLSCPSCARCVSLIDQYVRDVLFGVFSFSITMGSLFTKYQSAISGSEVICAFDYPMLTNIQTNSIHCDEFQFLDDIVWCLDQYLVPRSIFSINAWFLDHCFISWASLPLISRNHHHGSILDTLFAMLLFDQSMVLVFSFVTITKDIVFCVCLVFSIQSPRHDWDVKTQIGCVVM